MKKGFIRTIKIALTEEDVQKWEHIRKVYGKKIGVDMPHSLTGLILIREKYSILTKKEMPSITKIPKGGVILSKATGELRELLPGEVTYFFCDELPSGPGRLIADARRMGRKIAVKKDKDGWKVTRTL